MNLIDSLVAENWLKTPRIINAFRKIKRVDFLPEESKDLAEFNEAMSIGLGQTISQPLVVAFMLELLCPKPGQRIMDIGSGSGWTSALLADIVGKEGKVIAIEVLHKLKELGQKNASKYGNNIDFICANGVKGYLPQAPYDRILASAALNATSVSLQAESPELSRRTESPELSRRNALPQAWKDQLKTNGIIVTPMKNSIWAFRKLTNGKFEEKEYPGFIFVPFV